MKVYAGKSRMDETHVREGDIPAYFLWDDGSEYEVFANGDGTVTRRFHGPLFGISEWQTETF
jgi:hypothetical protein